jgi:hypothetical protein
VKNLILAFILLFLTAGHAETREGKAVYETSPELGMKISDVGLKNIEVQMTKVDGGGLLTFPKTALVYFQNDIGVYRRRDGWFKLIKVSSLKISEQSARIESSDLRAGDEVAIHGADLLRVAELDAFQGGE